MRADLVLAHYRLKIHHVALVYVGALLAALPIITDMDEADSELACWNSSGKPATGALSDSCLLGLWRLQAALRPFRTLQAAFPTMQLAAGGASFGPLDLALAEGCLWVCRRCWKRASREM